MFCDDDVLGLDMTCSKELFDTVALSVIVIVSKDLNVFYFLALERFRVANHIQDLCGVV